MVWLKWLLEKNNILSKYQHGFWLKHHPSTHSSQIFCVWWHKNVLLYHFLTSKRHMILFGRRVSLKTHTIYVQKVECLYSSKIFLSYCVFRVLIGSELHKLEMGMPQICILSITLSILQSNVIVEIINTVFENSFFLDDVSVTWSSPYMPAAKRDRCKSVSTKLKSRLMKMISSFSKLKSYV